jgi:hypothetical protein
VRIILADMTASGHETARLLLNDIASPVLLRDLIKHRVREEVARHNANPVPRYNGLVQPTDAEQTLNGYVMRPPRPLDWEKQAEVALAAFLTNGFFVFIGDRQIDDLDEELILADLDTVSFIRLVQLVGG